MKIEHININQLKFDERNPRIIDKDEFAGLVSSINEDRAYQHKPTKV
nr:MAG TPA: occlusion protein [Caudoviricetes sp.]